MLVKDWKVSERPLQGNKEGKEVYNLFLKNIKRQQVEIKKKKTKGGDIK